MVQRFSVWDSRELQAAILALRAANREIRKEIYKRTRELILPDWRESISAEIGSQKNAKLGYALIMNSTRVSVGTQDIRLQAATSSRKAPGTNLTPRADYFLYEYGGTPRVAQVKGRRGQTNYRYSRTVNTGLPPKTKYGRGADKAASKMVTRTIALWVASIVQIYNDAGRGKSL